jgi:hypothetical protein
MRKEIINKVLESRAIKVFSEYCDYIRDDWSDFDGRELMKVWNRTLINLEEELEKI